MTYSVVARDSETGALGVAVQSHFLGVGSAVPWARPGIGAVATQAMVDVGYGPKMLDLLAEGRPVQEAMRQLVMADEHSSIRQVAAVDGSGAVAAHTGDRCIAHAGHLSGDAWSVQANMMDGDGVPEAMAQALASTDGGLVWRLLAALDAAEEAGGDIRGRQSAAIVVVSGDTDTPSWERHFDLRVEDSPEPLAELRRLVAMHDAYRSARWDDPVLGGNPELPFWHALRLANAGDLDGARAVLEPIYRVDDRWRELVRRLPGTGVLDVGPDVIDALTRD